jgi:Helix-turn-helix domain
VQPEQLNETARPIASAEKLKGERRAKRLARIERIRRSLGNAASRLAYSPSEAAVALGKSPTWAYRKIYAGEFRVVGAGGRLMIPASEIAHFLAGASRYDPRPKKNGLEQNGNDKT